MEELLNEIDTNMNKIQSLANENDIHRRKINNIVKASVKESTVLSFIVWILSFMTVFSMCILGIWKYVRAGKLGFEELKHVNLLLLRCWYPVDDIYEK